MRGAMNGARARSATCACADVLTAHTWCGKGTVCCLCSVHWHQPCTAKPCTATGSPCELGCQCRKGAQIRAYYAMTAHGYHVIVHVPTRLGCAHVGAAAMIVPPAGSTELKAKVRAPAAGKSARAEHTRLATQWGGGSGSCTHPPTHPVLIQLAGVAG